MFSSLSKTHRRNPSILVKPNDGNISIIIARKTIKDNPTKIMNILILPSIILTNPYSFIKTYLRMKPDGIIQNVICLYNSSIIIVCIYYEGTWYSMAGMVESCCETILL